MPDYPPGKGLDPAVWTDARAAKLDNLDAAVSSRADGSAYTPARAANLDRLANIEANEAPVEGTANFLTTDTYPKTVVIVDTSGSTKRHLIDGYIDLTALASGESLTIRESMVIKSGGSAVKYAEVAYSDVQTVPLLHITTKPARYGLKIELVMSSAPAANRSFDYQLFKKSIA
jgi:hypothetical protein